MVTYIGKAIRQQKKETVRGLAKKAQVAPSTISKWESGHAIPDLAVLDIVARALEVSPWQLILFK